MVHIEDFPPMENEVGRAVHGDPRCLMVRRLSGTLRPTRTSKGSFFDVLLKEFFGCQRFLVMSFSLIRRFRVFPCSSSQNRVCLIMKLQICVFVACLGLSGVRVCANGGGYVKGSGYTGSFQPSGLESVEMVSEHLKITLYPEHVAVDVEYVLRNTGKPLTVTAGFPCTSWNPKKYRGSFFGNTGLSLDEMKMTLDGSPLAWKKKREKKPEPVVGQRRDWFGDVQSTRPTSVKPPATPEGDRSETWVHSWYVCSVPFAKGQSRTLRASYEAEYYQSGSFVSSNERNGASGFSYVFSSAAAWKGTIKEGLVEIINKGAHPDEMLIEPKDRFRRVGDRYVWNFKDFEPTPNDDLRVTAHQPYQVYRAYNRQPEDDESWGRVGDYHIRHNSYLFVSRYMSVEASSTLPNQGEFDYSPVNVCDWGRDSAWAEGAEGDGIGESLTLTPKKPLKAQFVEIFPGYGKDRETFHRNNRVKELIVQVNDGKEAKVYLDDTYGVQVFRLPGGVQTVEKLRLTIGDVYRGSKFRDTCISSVRLHCPLKKKPHIQGAR